MKDMWLPSYPAGVAHEIDPGLYSNLISLCQVAWERFPENHAFGNYSSYLSFAEVDRMSAAFAAYLQQTLNLQHGDRVALMMPNILQYPVAMFGVLRAGCVVVNTNPQYTARELRHQLSDSGAKCIVVFKNMLQTVHEVAPDTSLETVVATEIGDLFYFPKSVVFSHIARRGQPKSTSSFKTDMASFKTALKLGSAAALHPPPR